MGAGYTAEQAIDVVRGLLERAQTVADGEDFIGLVDAATEVARCWRKDDVPALVRELMGAHDGA